MSRKLGSGRRVLLVASWSWLAACSLDANLPGRNGSTPPVSSGVTLSGAGAPDADAAVGYGEGSRISDIHGKSSSSPVSTDGSSGGIGSGGAFDESRGEIGGAASNRGGAAGTGGRAARAGSSVNGEAAGAAGAVAEEPPPVLWFSEYIEGSSSNKALEITAPNRASLEGCKVSTYFNGKTEATLVATLSGVLEAGQVLTLCTSTLKEKLAEACTQTGNLTFNGDDAITLSCDGVLLDVIGQIGVDPGDAWSSDASSTADHTLRRKCSVQSGDPLGSDIFNPNTEWDTFPADTFDGLGRRGC